MICFWSHNRQRTKRFLAVDIVECHRAFRLLPSSKTVSLYGRRKEVVPSAEFDESTTPWTLLRITEYEPLKWLAAKHPMFPRTFILRGNIVDLDGNVVMEGPPC